MEAGPATVRMGQVRVFVVPTDRPERDGTFEWDRTTVVTVDLEAGGQRGLGVTYASRATAAFIDDQLRQVVEGTNAFDIPATHERMRGSLRNAGRSGAGALALSAVDIALHDLVGKLLGVPCEALFGSARQEVPVYGSGGFISYDDATLSRQLSGWVNEGLRQVKMKIGSNLPETIRRVKVARDAVGDDVGLFVDANGALDLRQSLAFAQAMNDLDVSWFEEPLSSDAERQLRMVRDRLPGAMELAAGEYVFESRDALRLLDAGSVDVLQADVTRCGGYTGFRRIASLCEAFATPLSGHTSPALHLPVGLSSTRLRHVEWFHDHVRLERLLFDGLPTLRNGAMQRPAGARAGHGLELKLPDASRFSA